MPKAYRSLIEKNFSDFSQVFSTCRGEDRITFVFAHIFVAKSTIFPRNKGDLRLHLHP
jgi:hypothetical protein